MARIGFPAPGLLASTEGSAGSPAPALNASPGLSTPSWRGTQQVPRHRDCRPRLKAPGLALQPEHAGSPARELSLQAWGRSGPSRPVKCLSSLPLIDPGCYQTSSTVSPCDWPNPARSTLWLKVASLSDPVRFPVKPTRISRSTLAAAKCWFQRYSGSSTVPCPHPGAGRWVLKR